MAVLGFIADHTNDQILRKCDGLLLLLLCFSLWFVFLFSLLVADGTQNTIRYKGTILASDVCKLHASHCPGFTLLQDNGRQHSARVSIAFHHLMRIHFNYLSLLGLLIYLLLKTFKLFDFPDFRLGTYMKMCLTSKLDICLFIEHI